MWWADTANDILKQRNGADSAWISILTLSTGAPLATIANFTSTGIDDNATSTAITIDASENVGIGTSSPDRALTVYTTTATDNNLLLKSGSANAYLTFADNGTTDQTGLSVRIGSSGNAMVFNTGGTTERMRIQSGGGISFNGDTAAANALDDYEEGTWTPTLTFNGSSTGITYEASYSTGWYTKVGNLVTMGCHLILSNKGSATGGAQINGLPFSTPDTAWKMTASHFNAGNITYTGQTQAYLPRNQTKITLRQMTESGTKTNITDSNIAGNSDFGIAVTFTTDS